MWSTGLSAWHACCFHIHISVFFLWGVWHCVSILVQRCGKPKNKFRHRYCTSCKYSAYILNQCTMRLSVALRIWNISRLTKYSMKNIGIRYLSKILEIWAKNVKGGSVKVEIFGNDKWDHFQKIPQNNFFHRRPLQCEI